MCFHCFDAKMSDSFRLCSLLSFFYLSIPSLQPLPFCTLEASEKRTAHCLNAWTFMLLILNPDPPMAWVPLFVGSQHLTESDMKLCIIKLNKKPGFLILA